MATTVPPSLLSTAAITFTPHLAHYCDNFQYDFDKSIALSTVFALCFFIGIFTVFAGYRFFRSSLFIQTFSVVGMLTYVIVSNFIDRSVILHGVISGATAVFFGILSMFVTQLGLLVTSFIQSIFITTCALYAVHIFHTVSNVFVAPSIALITFLILAVLILKWPRACSVMYICSYGAILVMLSIDFFMDLSMLRKMAFDNVMLKERKVEPCWFSWTLLALWPVLLFFGSVVQFLKTARNFDHRHKPHWYRRNKEPKVRLLSSKSDVIATAWIHPPVSPTPSEKSRHNYISNMRRDDEVFLMEDTTSV